MVSVITLLEAMVAVVWRLKLVMVSCVNNQIIATEKTVVPMLTVYHLVVFSKCEIVWLKAESENPRPKMIVDGG